MSEPTKLNLDVAKNKFQSGKPRYESPQVISLAQIVIGIGLRYDVPDSGAACNSGCIASDCNNGASIG